MKVAKFLLYWKHSRYLLTQLCSNLDKVCVFLIPGSLVPNETEQKERSGSFLSELVVDVFFSVWKPVKWAAPSYLDVCSSFFCLDEYFISSSCLRKQAAFYEVNTHWVNPEQTCTNSCRLKQDIPLSSSVKVFLYSFKLRNLLQRSFPFQQFQLFFPTGSKFAAPGPSIIENVLLRFVL